jgi:hypothetical protein
MGDNVNVNDANVNEDANEEDEVYVNAEWTEVQIADNADEGVTLLKIKNAEGYFNVAKVMRAINASFEGVPGFI